MTKVANVVLEYSLRPLVYGKTDCCQFAGAVVEALTGRNPMDDFTYTGIDGAAAITEKHGSLTAAIVSVLGEPKPIESICDGDVITVDTANGEICGVVIAGRAVVRDHNGLRGLNLGTVANAWGVK